LYVQSWTSVVELHQGEEVGLIKIRVPSVDVRAEGDVTDHILAWKSPHLWVDKCVDILVDLGTHDIDGGVSKTYGHLLGADLSTGMCKIEWPTSTVHEVPRSDETFPRPGMIDRRTV
jgi:hypothetical protein